MTEPRRLLDEASGIDRAILESARDDVPSLARRRRVVAAVSVTSAAVSSSAVAAASWKIVVGIAAITGIGVGGAVMHARNSRSSPAVTPSVLIVPSAATAVPIVVPTAVVVSAPAPQPPSASVVAPPAPRPIAKKAVEQQEATPSIAHEIELIDRARKAVGKGDAKGAHAALDQYDADCAGGALSLEASVLRIEAHAAAGDRDRAGALARKFLERHPQSAYDARVRVHLPNP